MSIDLSHTATTKGSVEEVVKAVQGAVAAKGFRVLNVEDVQATLAEKGIAREPYKIIEVCNAKYAHQALQADSLIGLMMPCKINVFSERGETKIALLNPSVLVQFFPQAKLEALSQEIETVLRAVVDAARQF